MQERLVVAVDVKKEFLHEGNVVEVLRGVDLELRTSEMVCVVGASGAGKSTLLHLLGTLDLPSSGRIEFGGKDVTKLSSGQLARFRNESIGFVFQFHHLLPEFTAVENVMMPGLIRGLDRGKLRKEATELLEEVGLKHRLKHRPGELSGGEQQRVALARALVRKPKLILADEPTGNLDSETSEAIHKLFFELNRSRGTTFLIVTHSRDLAAKMPRVVAMKDGRILRDAHRGDTYRDGDHTDEVVNDVFWYERDALPTDESADDNLAPAAQRDAPAETQESEIKANSEMETASESPTQSGEDVEEDEGQPAGADA